jgi:hypothetical protein
MSIEKCRKYSLKFQRRFLSIWLQMLREVSPKRMIRDDQSRLTFGDVRG